MSEQPPDPGGIVRPARRPPGFVAPGPAPAGPGDDPALWPGPGEDLCYLTGDWRIFQKIVGHRWSMDDLVTAWYALTHAPPHASTTFDMGCGVGSVLMMVAWGLPKLRSVGVEAQPESAALARRSLRYNGCDARVTVRDGDLRDPALFAPGTTFDLITGTPPYKPTHEGVVSALPQRGPCRFEFRGGVEAYCEVAKRWLAPQGRFVVCEGWNPDQRTLDAIEAAGLVTVAWRPIIPREGKAPLLSVFVAAHPGDASAATQPDPPLTIRDRAGQRTPEFQAVRARMGIPP